jgi:sec-independent protein translocase protein TatA
VSRDIAHAEVFTMGSFSIWHWLIVGVVVLLVFGGKGKISDIMGDFAKGIKSFKKGLADDEDKTAPPAASEPAKTIEQGAQTAEKAQEPHKVG